MPIKTTQHKFLVILFCSTLIIATLMIFQNCGSRDHRARALSENDVTVQPPATHITFDYPVNETGTLTLRDEQHLQTQFFSLGNSLILSDRKNGPRGFATQLSAYNQTSNTIEKKSVHINGITADPSLGLIYNYSQGFSISVWVRPTSRHGGVIYFKGVPGATGTRPSDQPLDFYLEVIGVKKSGLPSMILLGATREQFFSHQTYDPIIDTFSDEDGDSPTNIQTYKWSNILFTCGPNGLRLFLNGELKGQAANCEMLNHTDTGGDFYIGTSSPQLDNPLVGYIDDLRIYQYELTNDDIASLSSRDLVTNPSFAVDFNKVTIDTRLAETSYGSHLGESGAVIDLNTSPDLGDYLAVGAPDGGLQKGADNFGGAEGYIVIYDLKNAAAAPTPTSYKLLLRPPYQNAFDFGKKIVAGDFDNDGLSDLVIGDPGWKKGAPSGLQIGRVTIFYGHVLKRMIEDGITQLAYPYPTNGSGVDTYPFQSIFIPLTSVANNRFGSQLAVVNRTGADGLLIKAGAFNSSSSTSTSAEHVFFLNQPAAWVQPTNPVNNSALTTLSFVNNSVGTESGGGFGDGLVQLNENLVLISAPFASNSQGQVIGHSISGSTIARTTQSTSGGLNGVQLGRGLSAADYNCDGRKDILFNSRLKTLPQNIFGSILGLIGISVTPYWLHNVQRDTIFFENENQGSVFVDLNLDFKAASARSIPSDACDSLAISVPGYSLSSTQPSSGTIWIYTGSDATNQVVFNMQSFPTPLRLTPEVDQQLANTFRPYRKFGGGFVIWHDYDSDGDQDLIVGSNGTYDAQFDEESTEGLVTFIKNLTTVE